MAEILQIRKYPDPVLKKVAEPVQDFGEGFQGLVDNMIETLKSRKTGVGLAAPQVGVLLRVFIMKLPLQAVRVVVNPEIVSFSGKEERYEGCLSFHLSYTRKMSRHKRVRLKFKDRYGVNVDIKLQGLEARCVQHEIDHLNGITIDRDY